MRIAYITAGAGGTICGNCLRDNALVTALRAAGHDALLLPVYTPVKTDEANVSQHKVYLGGLNLYLEMKYAWARRLPRFLMNWLDSPALLDQVSKFAVKTLPEDLGQMTLTHSPSGVRSACSRTRPNASESDSIPSQRNSLL
jgi:hypothetical protein